MKELWFFLFLSKAITRAFGDIHVKNKVYFNITKGVIVEPYVKKIELRMIHKYLILATDGLWDVV